jgi:hypothetical protein
VQLSVPSVVPAILPPFVGRPALLTSEEHAKAADIRRRSVDEGLPTASAARTLPRGQAEPRGVRTAVPHCGL